LSAIWRIDIVSGFGFRASDLLIFIIFDYFRAPPWRKRFKFKVNKKPDCRQAGASNTQYNYIKETPKKVNPVKLRQIFTGYVPLGALRRLKNYDRRSGILQYFCCFYCSVTFIAHLLFLLDHHYLAARTNLATLNLHNVALEPAIIVHHSDLHFFSFL